MVYYCYTHTIAVPLGGASQDDFCPEAMAEEAPEDAVGGPEAWDKPRDF